MRLSVEITDGDGAVRKVEVDDPSARLSERALRMTLKAVYDTFLERPDDIGGDVHNVTSYTERLIGFQAEPQEEDE